jgi:hypothetical protein
MSAKFVRTFFVLLAVLSCAMIVPRLGMAQIGGSGSITGTITDSTGAVIPNATVEATNSATGVKTSRQTSDSGSYTISPLEPGKYSISVSVPGFKSLVQENIVVDALSKVGADLSLQVGTPDEQVVVTDTPPQLSTNDARLGTTIRNEVYTALPLSMGSGAPRDPTAFISLAPGVQGIARWGNFSGGQDFSNEQYVDGVPITNSVAQGEGRNLQLGISVESIDQFQVETSGTSVQFSGQGSSNFVVKSGTNDFHGSAFEFMRNKVLNARGFFAPERRQDNQNEFGFNLGGPIVKNKLFFFTSYDGYRFRQQSPAQLTSVPTLAMRNGDFSALSTPIYDPLTTVCTNGQCTRQQFQFNGRLNVIPPSRISAISQSFQSLLPTPTNSALQNNYLGTVPVGYNNNSLVAKVDYNYSERHRFSALFSHGKRTQATPYREVGNPQAALPLPYTETRLVEEIPTTGQLKHTFTISPELVNQLSLGFSRLWVPITNATVSGDYPTKAGLKGLPAGEAASSFPEIVFSGPNAPTQWRGTNARAFTEALNTYTIQDNLQWVKGNHSMTFGFQGQRLDANEFERALGSNATFSFSNLQTAGFSANGAVNSGTGNAYASYLLGAVNNTNVVQDSVIGTSGRFYNAAVWASDDWKVSPKFTLNLGMRYDIMLPYREKYDRWSFFNPTLPNPAANGYPGALQFVGDGENSCNCATPIKTYYGNIGPRIGFAYSPTEKLVLRGAYGIMYSRRGAVGGRGGARNGTGLTGYSANVTFTGANNFDSAYFWNNGVPAYPLPPSFDPSINAGFTTTRPSASGVTFGDFDLGGHPPRYQNWNLGFQYSLTQTLTMGLAYAGSNGHFLGGGGRGKWSNQIDPKYLALKTLLNAQATPTNIAAAQAIFPEIHLPYANFAGPINQMLRPFPQYSSFSDIYGDVGNSNYNSMQFTLEQRLSKGLIFNFNYTYSKQIDDTGGSRSAYNWKTEKAVGVNDQPHIWNLAFVYDSPFGRSGMLEVKNPIGRALLGGWKISGITQFRSGRPLGTIVGNCNLPNAGSCYADYNPNFSGPVRINGDWNSGNILGSNPTVFIDKNAFQSAAAFTYGNTPRTMAYGLRMPSYFNQDLSIVRKFNMFEKVSMSLGADVFNVFNQVVFGGINTNITSANFGRVTSQINSPRAVQLKARFEF